MNQNVPSQISPEDWSQTPASVQSFIQTTRQRLSQFEQLFNKVEQYNQDQVVPPAHILVVDDNQLNRNILTRRLEKQGYVTDIAADGREAVTKIEQYPFDLVLLDIMMPEMDGYEVLAYLQAQGRLPGLAIVVITAVDEMQSAVRCIEMGAEDYLAKPFNPALLTARITACLEKKRLQDQQRAYITQLNLENERKSAELERARRTQRAMLPASPPQLPHLEIVAGQQTASEVGGDYYDFLSKPQDHLWIAVGDATGYGAASGLMVSATKIALLAMEETDIHQQLHKVNRLLTQTKFDQPINIALLLAEFAPLQDNQVTVTLVGGGMPPTYIWRLDGSIDEVVVPGLPLGVLGEATYEQHKLHLQVGEVIVIMTDGLSEMFNERGHMLGYERLMDALKQIPALTLTAQETLNQIETVGHDWAGIHPLADDLTFVVVKITA